MLYSAVDYSMSCPAVTVFESSTISTTVSFKNCRSFFLIDKKKFVQTIDNITGTFHQEFASNEQRFDNISDWVMDILRDSTFVFIEGYSFASKGVVFNIGENTGVLKHKLYKASLPFAMCPPASVKKFFTGHGNSKKTDMYESFLKSENIDIRKLWGADRLKPESPFADIVDSFAILKYGITNLLKHA